MLLFLVEQRLYITFDIKYDIVGDTTFGHRGETRAQLLRIAKMFRQKGAISLDKAMSIEELGLPSIFKDLMKGRLGRLGVFMEVEGKYYLSEEMLEEVEELFEHPSLLPPRPPPFRHMIRHTASVPKGFLRYCVLKFLKENSMSGSEIMNQMEKETNGHWKPSPGSVYPLLAWLQDRNYTKEIPTEEGVMKRYMLTEKGERFLEEQTKFGERLREKLEFLAPPFFSGFWLSPHSEKLRRLRKPVKRFVKALLNLRRALEQNLTEQALKEIGEFLNITAEKMEEMSSKLEDKKSRTTHNSRRIDQN